jgi:hypothetical protein
MAGDRLIIERFANITDGTVVGVRAPYLRIGGNEQFNMMTDQFFAYDSSITAPLGRVPLWPYTLHFRYLLRSRLGFELFLIQASTQVPWKCPELPQ